LYTHQQKFFELAEHRIKFGSYLLYKLPAAFFSGVRVIEINEKKCVTIVPFKWLTQNPFRSTYFASLAMAAEMSTGALALSNVYRRTPVISMLVTRMEASFYKKAKGAIFFTCEQGNEFASAIDDAAATGNSCHLTSQSTGINKDGDVVAEFLFTWSFKAKVANIQFVS
jgi:hypothetical protein